MQTGKLASWTVCSTDELIDLTITTYLMLLCPVMIPAYDRCKKSVNDLKIILTSDIFFGGKVTFSSQSYKLDPRSKFGSILEKQTNGPLYCFYHAIHCLLNRQLFCNDLADKVIPALANYIYPGVVVDNATGVGLKSPEYFNRTPHCPSECGFEVLTNFSGR